MNAKISVVTAVHQPHLQFLDDAYESLRMQDKDLVWEWLIQVDGNGVEEIPEKISDDPRVRIGQNRPSGPGTTRTMALAQSSSEFIRVLDADDRLLPGSLLRDVSVLEAKPQVGWTVGPALDLHPDGSTTSWDKANPASGLLPRGWLLKKWRENQWAYLPVLPSTLCIRRRLLLALGGWMALTTSEDTGLLAAANTLTVGWMHSEPSSLYRQHDGQITRTDAHCNVDGLQDRRALIVERAESLAEIVGHA